MCEDALIRQAQSGDASAFAKLLDWVYDIILRFALKWAGNRVDAEDITQNVCIKLASVIQQFRFESAFTSWLYRLVINCAHDWRRKENRGKTQQAASGENEATSSEQITEVDTELSRVLAQVEVMGKGYKETLLLVFAEGLTHVEAAKVLSVNESTISWRIHDIRKRLKLTQGASSVKRPISRKMSCFQETKND